MKAAGRRILHSAIAAFLAIAASAGASDQLTAQDPPAARPSVCDAPGFPAPTLCARAGLDTLRARFIIMLDESGSMQSRWRTVIDALGNLAAAIPDGDELDLWLFSGDSRRVVPTAPATPELRASWRRDIERLSAPRGQSTDLGVAADRALTATKDAPASQLQYIFFLTDGQHQPSAGSEFGGASAEGAWQRVREQARLLLASRETQVVIVRLDATADTRTLQSVFSDAMQIDALGPGDLTNWFATLTRQLAVAKLAAVVRAELRSPAASLLLEPAASLHAGRASDVAAQIVSSRRVLLTEFPAGEPSDAGELGSVAVADSVMSGATLRLRWSGPSVPIWTPPWVASEEIDITVPVRTRVGPVAELDLIGVQRASGLDSMRIRGRIHRKGALADPVWWAAAVALVLAAGLLVQRARWALHRPQLRGSIIVRSPEDRNAQTRHRLGDVKTPDFVVNDLSGTPTLRIAATSRRGRTVLIATAIASGVSTGGRPLVGALELHSKIVFLAVGSEITFTN